MPNLHALGLSSRGDQWAIFVPLWYHHHRIVVKNAFERNIFNEDKQFEYSSITPNQISRISQKTSSNSYNITVNYDLDLNGVLDNQKRPVSELFLTIINKLNEISLLITCRNRLFELTGLQIDSGKSEQ